MDKKGTYILIGAAGGYISGGPIYQRNKAIFMKQQGWDVYYISCCHGKVYIDGLENFIVGVFTFIAKPAYLFPKKYQTKLIRLIIERIACKTDNVVVETGTDYSAYWGELLAEQLKGRHIVTLLDEYNDKINQKVAPFYKFKYDRRELACISDEVMVHIFGDLIPASNESQYSVPCYCTNSLADTKPSWIDDIPKGDLVIGYIGRLDKKAVPVIIEGIKTFAEENVNLQIIFLCIGGSDVKLDRDNILCSFSECSNVRVYITGLLFPIPIDCVRKCDLIFSTAGSCSVGAKASVPTVRIHQITNAVQGFVQKIGCADYYQYQNAHTVYDYICLFLQGQSYPKSEKYDLSNEWIMAEKCFEKHLDVLNKAESKLSYFDFRNIKLTWKERIYKYSMLLLGMRLHQLLWKKWQ